MSFKPTEEMKAAYKWARLCGQIDFEGYLADLAQHAMAAALEAEFQVSNIKLNLECANNVDWLRLADEKLREVKR